MSRVPQHPVVNAPKAPPQSPAVHYTVSIPAPSTHELHARMDITLADTGEAPLALIVRMPAWTPGSYKIREFARNISDMRAQDGRGQLLGVTRLDKDGWRVELPAASAPPASRRGNSRARKVVLSWRVYAFELSVRTPHVDDTHAFFQPTNALPYIEGYLDAPAILTMRPPTGWRVYCPLPRLRGRDDVFVAPNYDVLADSPVECGRHESVAFTVDGKRHEIVMAGWGNYNLARMAEDFPRIVETGRAMFGPLPYDNYMFILHARPAARGGLEHLNSQVSAWPSFDFTDREKYEDFLSLISHEYFHCWNVKRIRPAALGPFDYGRENYTPYLWAMEGLTVYYEWLLLLRAGLTDRARVLKAWSEEFQRWEDRPGMGVMSLAESSHLAWTKLYLADENFINTGISYYHKGFLVGLLLDLEIRERTKDQRSLDDVMRLLFERYGYPKAGFPAGGFEAAVAEIAGGHWEQWFRDHIEGTGPLDFAAPLRAVGLVLEHEKVEIVESDGVKRIQPDQPWTGWELEDKNGGSVILSSVRLHSPASKAGLSAKDEIVALGGIRIRKKEAVDVQLKRCRPGDVIDVTMCREDRLLDLRVVLDGRPAGKLTLKEIAKPGPAQKARLRRWLPSSRRSYQ